jgi:hypothetical protein
MLVRSLTSNEARLLTSLGITALLLHLVCPSSAGAWSSKSAPLFERVHQKAIENVLQGTLDADSLKVLQDQQAFVDQHQKPNESGEHAMTGIEDKQRDEKKERPLYIKESEKYVRDRLRQAITARQSGNTSVAFTQLGQAIHPLTDSSSPAHTGFQAWRYDETIWSIARHVYAERLYPDGEVYGTRTTGLRACLEGAVRWAYDIFMGVEPLPPQFFHPETGALLLPRKYSGCRQ